MKIFILRHEDRSQDCSFFSPLTEQGLNNAKKLKKYLLLCNINIIFSSPFIRTLQTIKPYIDTQKSIVNIEYGLSEIHHEDIIAKKSVGLTLPIYLAKYYNYNCNYNSIIKSYQIKYPEIYEDVVKRIKIVLQRIIKKYGNTNNNILLVTHQSLCSAILEIINKNTNLQLDTHTIMNYPLGKLTLVFDNYWCYKLIN